MAIAFPGHTRTQSRAPTGSWLACGVTWHRWYLGVECEEAGRAGSPGSSWLEDRVAILIVAGAALGVAEVACAIAILLREGAGDLELLVDDLGRDGAENPVSAWPCQCRPRPHSGSAPALNLGGKAAKETGAAEA